MRPLFFTLVISVFGCGSPDDQLRSRVSSPSKMNEVRLYRSPGSAVNDATYTVYLVPIEDQVQLPDSRRIVSIFDTERDGKPLFEVTWRSNDRVLITYTQGRIRDFRNEISLPNGVVEVELQFTGEGSQLKPLNLPARGD